MPTDIYTVSEKWRMDLWRNPKVLPYLSHEERWQIIMLELDNEIVNSFYGKNHTDEWKRNASIRTSGKNNPMYGTKRGKECSNGGLFGEKNGMYGKSRKGEKLGGTVNPLFGTNNGMYGKKHSENAKEKQRQAALKRPKDSEETRKKKSLPGNKNPMYGRSAVKEKNLKWYTNGVKVIYIPEGTQPNDYQRGRKLWQ